MKPLNRVPNLSFCGTRRSRPSHRLAWVVGLAWVALSAHAADHDWFRWRGPHLNGISTETGWLARWPQSGPQRLWQRAIGQGYSSFATSQGRLYTMGVLNKKETVWCLDAATGAPIWQHAYPYVFKPKYYDGGSSATPTVDAERVYSLGQGGELFCFEAASGKMVWSKNITEELDAKVGMWGLASSPLVEGDRLILNIGSHGTALDKHSGKVLWTSGKEGAAYASAVPYTLGDTRALALFVAKAAVGVELATGKLRWTFPWKTDWDVHAADPIVVGDRIFISSGYNHGCALLQLTDGKPTVVYENDHMRNMFNPCVLIDDHLYGVDGDNDKKSYLRCIALKDGRIQWTFNDFEAGALAAADGKLIVQGKAGQLAIIDASPAAPRVVSMAQVLGGQCWTTPVLSNGRIYCRNSKGDLVCLDVSAQR